MSVAASVATSKGEKSKKFQSLNINNLYQGSVTKPSQRSVPQKQGLQSLGKIPTARRAPANLPSLKAETSTGGETNVTKTSGSASAPASAGWKDEGQGGQKDAERQQGEVAKQNDVATKPLWMGGGGGAPGGGTGAGASAGAAGVGAGTGPGAVPGAGAGAFPVKPKPSFLHQESPLFGQEFPSLGGGKVGDGSAPKTSSSSAHQGSSAQASPMSAAAAVAGGGGNAAAGGAGAGAGASKSPEVRYGPGPNLRPQTSGNWMFGGGAKAGQPGQPMEEMDVKGAAAHNNLEFPPKAIFPPPPPVMMPKNLEGIRRGGAGMCRGPMMNNGPPRSGVTPVSIIDKEKLKRMDYIDSAEDDWAKTDDTFDYNKRLASDDEDEWGESSSAPQSQKRMSYESRRHGKVDPVPPSHLHPHGQPPPHSHSHSHSHSHVSAGPPAPPAMQHEDEERERSRKKEEILKNVERARKRREEEENKYRSEVFQEQRQRHHQQRAGSEDPNHYSAKSERTSGEGAKIPQFGNFDVGGRSGSQQPGGSSGYKGVPRQDVSPSKPAPTAHAGNHHTVIDKNSYGAGRRFGGGSMPPTTKLHEHEGRKTSPKPAKIHKQQQQHHQDSRVERDQNGFMAHSRGERERERGASENDEFCDLKTVGDKVATALNKHVAEEEMREDRKKTTVGGFSAMGREAKGDKKSGKRLQQEPQQAQQQHVSDVDSKNKDSRGSKRTSKAPGGKPAAATSATPKLTPAAPKGYESDGSSYRSASSPKPRKSTSPTPTPVLQQKEQEQQQQQQQQETEHKQQQQPFSSFGLENVVASGFEQHGGFTPRGQPSRRGRGGASNRGSRGGHSVGGGVNPSSASLAGEGMGTSDIHSVKDQPGLAQPVALDLKEEASHNRWSSPVDEDEEHRSRAKQLQQQQRMIERGMGQQKQSYERRQNKLPPRLAKQREQNRLAQKSRGDGWSSGGVGESATGAEACLDSGWRGGGGMQPQTQQHHLDNLTDMLDKMDKELQQSQSRADESQEPDLPVQTIIFENTNLKGAASASSGGGRSAVSSGLVGGVGTAAMGTRTDKLFKNEFKVDGGTGGLQMPIGFASTKPEDSADLKLDFSFGEPDIGVTGVGVVEDKLEGGAGGIKSLSGHPSTEDLNLKIASVKKVWETRPPGSSCMPPISESAVANNAHSTARGGSGGFGQRYQADDAGGGGTNSGASVSARDHGTGAGGGGGGGGALYDKHDGSNVAKVRPQQQQQQQQQLAASRAVAADFERQRGVAAAAIAAAAANYANNNRNPASVGSGASNTANANASAAAAAGSLSAALPSPPSMLASQPPSLYQAFQIDGRSVTNQLYPAYAAAGVGLGGQSMLLQSAAASAAAGAHDLFGQSAAASNQFRLQAAAAAAQFAAAANQPPPGPQHSSGNTVLISQPGGGSMMNSSMKQVQSPQIGPIGTKGGAGLGQGASGLGTLPPGPPPAVTAGSSPGQLLIPYDTNPMSYMASALQGPPAGRGGHVGSQSGQTAFYHTLAAASANSGAAAAAAAAGGAGAHGNAGGRHFGLHGFSSVTSTQAGLPQHLGTHQSLRGQQTLPSPSVSAAAAAAAIAASVNPAATAQQTQTVAAKAPTVASTPVGTAAGGGAGASGLTVSSSGATYTATQVTQKPVPAPGAGAAVVDGTYNPTPIQRPQGSSSVSTEAVGDAQETMKAADKVAEAAATGGTNAN